ncbi:hypothetical protein CURTO8I2_250211 [Curtobacterium sp. 8I-2]|nr:hypothetical protein CURTO8I2_250211 [Curtobacterium sp. 8I-2]
MAPLAWDRPVAGPGAGRGSAARRRAGEPLRRTSGPGDRGDGHGVRLGLRNVGRGGRSRCVRAPSGRGADASWQPAGAATAGVGRRASRRARGGPRAAGLRDGQPRIAAILRTAGVPARPRRDGQRPRRWAETRFQPLRTRAGPVADQAPVNVEGLELEADSHAAKREMFAEFSSRERTAHA